MSVSGRRRDLLVVICAVSAGIHAGLAPEHVEEGLAAGLGFAASAVLLGALATWLTISAASRSAVASTGGALLVLIAAYALATTTGVPLVHPAPEPLDGLALATKAVEAAGVLIAASVLRHVPRAHMPFIPTIGRNPT